MSEITITVTTTGATSTVTYAAYETDAPIEFDGFGTRTVYKLATKRVVLIDKQHLEWQLNRYGSGLYPFKPQPRLESYLFDKVHQALAKGLEVLVEK